VEQPQLADANQEQETEEQEEVKFTNKFGKKDFSKFRG
jgi:hypothetical protein